MNPAKEDQASALRLRGNELEKAVAACLEGPVAPVGVESMTGDASSRRYFRVKPKPDAAGESAGSLVVMQLERPVTGEPLDFILIQEFLHRLDLPVPGMFRYDAALGLLFLEDLGDETLEARLGRSSPAEISRWYDAAVDQVALLQTRAKPSADTRVPAFHRRFDVDKLMWEMDFMLTHYVEGLLNSPLSAARRRQVRQPLLALCRDLAGRDPCFVHRDYHSRNLMVHAGRLVMIDFQDARLGPCQYDLVSLLRDAYFPLPEGVVEEKKERFLRQKEVLEGREMDRAGFHAGFDLMTIQRSLKAVGTFASQKEIHGRDRYLPCIPRTLGYVQKALGNRPEWASLQSALHEVVPGCGPDSGSRP
ncbi:MAG: aminoglycoside phosphotransferase family protein [Nitrospinaceae bacterium]